VRRYRTLSLLVVLVLAVTACGRGDEVADPDDGATTTVSSDAPGAFGDLGQVCGPAPEGEELTDTDTGVTASSIQI
jgi:hypothetical protein